MSVKEARTNHDPLAFYGEGFPSILDLHVGGNIAKYVGGLDIQFLPLAVSAQKDLNVGYISDYQIVYGIPGVGGSGSDSFRLQLVDNTPLQLQTGTVSTSGTTLTGSGTSFQSTLIPYVTLVTNGTNTFLVTAVASNTSATLEAAPASNWSGATFWTVPYIKTLATISIPANTQFISPVDLRTSLKGLPIARGQGLRVDSAAVGTGYSTTPANLRIRIGVEMYGITV